MFSLLFLRRDFLLVLFFRLGICLPSLWSAPSPLHDFALMPLFLAKVRLSPTLTLSSLMIWYSGQTALFLFLLVKATPALLANWSLCGTETTLCFSSGPVCSSVSAEACTIVHAFANLGSTNKSGIFLLFSSYLTLVLSSPLCPLLHLSSYLKLCGGHSSQDTSHLILHYPATDFLRRSLFGDSQSLYDLWFRPMGVARLLVSMVFRHASIPRKGWGNQRQQQQLQQIPV